MCCSDEIQHIKLPRDIEDAQNLGLVLSRYTDKYYYEVIGGYLVTFILYPFMFIEHIVMFSSSSDGVAECYKCCCLPRAQFTILGAIQGLRNTVGGGGVSFHGKKAL